MRSDWLYGRDESGQPGLQRKTNLPRSPFVEESEASGRGVLEGKLVQRNVETPVTVRLASATSLFVRFPFGNPPQSGDEFDALVVHLAEEPARLTRCRFVQDHGLPGQDGQLLFLDDVYDCRALIAEGKVLSSRAAFHNVSLVLGQKDKIDPRFRDFTVNFLFDLGAFKKFFDEQELSLSREPHLVRTAGEETLLRTEGRAFLRYLDEKIAELDTLVSGMDRDAYDRHGFFLRRLAADFIASSIFLRRTNEKPRGYAGDAEMMLMAYENEYVGDTLFGQLLHKHPLETKAAQAVRSRKDLVARASIDVRKRFDERLTMLSVACGPAAELENIFRAGAKPEQSTIMLLDQDRYALEYAERTVQKVEAQLGAKVNASFVGESVRTMLRRPKVTASWGKFNFIYSMGLFDYLTPFVAQAVLHRMYDLLEPGGTAVVGNFHVSNPTRHYMAYLMDWVLYHRTEDELLELTSGLRDAKTSLAFDPSGCQMFLTVEKPR